MGWCGGKLEDAMIGRASLVIVALAVGVAAASLVPGLAESVRKAIGLAAVRGSVQVREDSTTGGEPRKPNSESAGEQQSVKLTGEQIAAARIDLVAVQGGTLARHLTVHGTVLPHADRIGEAIGHRGGTAKEAR